MGDNMKERKGASFVCTHRILCGIATALFFAVGGPILINLCYSCDCVLFITQWEAKDVLSYYGMIFSAAVAAVSLIATIRFTRKQIEHSSYIKAEYRKWETIEQQVNAVLDTIAPLNMNADYENILNFFDVPRNCVHHLRLYRLNANNALNRLVILTSSIESADLQKLIDAIKIATVDFCNMASEEIKMYDQIVAEKSKCIINDEMVIARCNQRIDELDYQLGNKCVPNYHMLLSEKQRVFDAIYKAIDCEANKKILK